MTVKETIKAKILEENGIKPKRTKEELEQAKKAKNILEQEFREREEGDYRTIDLGNLQTTAAGSEDEENGESVNIDSIRHTDAIVIGSKSYNVVAAKTTSEVLDKITDGKYQCISFYVDFRKMDADTLETTLRNFQPSPIDLPRGRKGVEIEDGMIVVTPAINGFKITTLLESIDESSAKRLEELLEWIDCYQGYTLEKTLSTLHSMGVPTEELMTTQATVGLIPKARRIWERKKAKEVSNNIITPAIRSASRDFAEALNQELSIPSLTGTAIEIGFQIFTVEVSTDPVRKSEWKSKRSNLSYFAKGNTEGRIERVAGNRRRIPVTQSQLEEAKNDMISFIPAVLTRFENVARKQLDYTNMEPVVPLPEKKSAKTKNVVELFGYSQEDFVRMTHNFNEKAMDKVNNDFLENVANHISVLSKFLENLNMGADEEEENSEQNI